MLSRILGAIGLVLLSAAPAARAQDPQPGLPFLTLGGGGRAIGMGDAYTASAGDPASIVYNPATLSAVGATAISFMHRSWIQGTDMEHLAGAFDLGRFDIGVSVGYLSTGDIEVRETPGPALTTFSARNAVMGITLAYEISPGLSAGLTGKYLYEKILIDEATGKALDLGILYGSAEGLRLGAAIQNLGSMSELGSEASELPKTLRGGAAYTTDLSSAVRLTGALDVATPLGDGATHVLVGGEGLFYGAISVRGGYQSGYDSRGLTAGTGFRHGIVAIDYAFAPMQYDLGSTHAIAVSLRFQ